MRIVYLVHQYLPDHIGGTEIYTHGLARRAKKAGYDVTVFTYRESPSPRQTGFKPRKRFHEGIPVIEFPYNLSVAPNIARFEYDNAVVGEEVRLALAKWKPDLVHMTHGMKLSASALDACRSLSIPIVLTLCDYWFLCPRATLLTWDGRLCEGPTQWRECFRCVQDLHGIKDRLQESEAVKGRSSHMRTAMATADRVLALSNFQKGMFVSNSYDADLIEVLPLGIEGEGLQVSRTRSNGRPTLFVLIGSIVPHKGVHVVCEAMKGLPELVADLTIYGALRRGDAYVESLLASTHGDPRITFAGAFSPREAGRILADADFVLAPYLSYEGSSIVVKTAQHVGVPVIASRIGSLADMVTEGTDGWFVEPGDVEGWGKAMQRAVDERALWPQRPTPQPDMDHHFQEIAAVYGAVLSRRAPHL